MVINYFFTPKLSYQTNEYINNKKYEYFSDNNRISIRIIIE